jgi:hypothetical protein
MTWIQKRVYGLFEQREGGDGMALDDWLRAEHDELEIPINSAAERRAPLQRERDIFRGMRVFILLLMSGAVLAAQENQQTWAFDSLTSIGGNAVKVLGDPKLIDTPAGKAVEFDGDGDALFFDVHPLAGAASFTWEVIFRPDGDGAREQRFFHLQENGSQNRLMFESRVLEGGWYLDAFANSGESKPLMVPEKLHPADRWYHIAQVYDGSEYRSYVNGELQMAAPLKLKPQGEGRTSAGVRINLVDYFKGAIRLARFSRRALSPAEFLPPPK